MCTKKFLGYLKMKMAPCAKFMFSACIFLQQFSFFQIEIKKSSATYREQFLFLAFLPPRIDVR